MTMCSIHEYDLASPSDLDLEIGVRLMAQSRRVSAAGSDTEALTESL